MKKVLAIFLVIITAIFIWIFGKMIPDILTNNGKVAYESGNYQEALSNLRMAIQFSPKNTEARYYYVKTLIKLPPTLDVQKEIYKVSQVNSSDSANLIADMQISKWKNEIFLESGENYIEQATFSDKILRWDVTKFPLKVYIENNSTSAPPYYQDEIKKAFLQWQASTGRFIKFEFINNAQNANIRVSINAPENIKCPQGNCKYTVAYTTPIINNDLLKRMDILFYDSNNLGQPFKEREIYDTALHEIGHSLGIMGHSYNKDDLMYMETNNDRSFDSFRSDFQLISSNDLNTLKLLYKLVPDITNTPLSKFDKTRQLFAPIVMGSDKQINSRKMLEAQNYIKSAPNLPNGYIDLASAYAEEKQYNNTIENLNKALSLCSNNNEKFVVYYNFAVTYTNIKDWENALNYANMAEQINTNSDIDGLLALINYNLGNKEQAKKSYAEALQKNPDNIVNSINLTRIYLKEFNLPQAGRVLNRLIQANPEAKNDPMVKAYGLIILLFK